MSHIKKLEKLLKDNVIPEIKENIVELEALIGKKKNEKKILEELKYMQEVKAYFDEAIINIENKSMTEEIAYELLQGLEEMEMDEDEV